MDIGVFRSSVVMLVVPGRDTITPELVKKSIPVVDFAEFIKGSGVPFKDVDDDDVESICAVCFSRLQMCREIRKLSNCSHVFHVGCLDKWLDQGHMTCPVCRSTLLAEEGGEKEGRKDSWMVERIAYLFGEDLVTTGLFGRNTMY
ncbi:E3 ubiquitin-protein ligase RHA1B-like protein [Cinnamomum micranthum f. kanehirae]|uniref:E3 ubiquitin-protein ligase RHA1B-like protein n=1 Tax=Cinnamomum micranthum f. kanehirae TaxID=337451 RepID=A0A443PAF1_9MAGN|nr:E3 ubiquitin-protein ligase RHA1B-like protein [Cinnamomum micranthum f. kanehirae]